MDFYVIYAHIEIIHVIAQHLSTKQLVVMSSWYVSMYVELYMSHFKCALVDGKCSCFARLVGMLQCELLLSMESELAVMS